MSDPTYLRESVHVREALDKVGSVWGVTLIQEGMSRNRRYYPREALADAAPLFEGKWCNIDHTSLGESRDRPEGTITRRAGVYKNVRVVPHTRDPGKVQLDAELHIVLPWVREALRNAHELGVLNEWAGISIDAQAKSLIAKFDSSGLAFKEVAGIRGVDTADIVTEPAAGGSFNTLLESESTGGIIMPELDIDALRDEMREMATTAATSAAEAAGDQFRTALQEAVEEMDASEEPVVSATDPTPEDEAEDEEDEAEDAGDDEGVTEAAKRIKEAAAEVEAFRDGLRLQEAQGEIGTLVSGSDLPEANQERVTAELTRLLEAGAYTPETGEQIMEAERDLVARMFQANPAGTPRGTGPTQTGSGVEDYVQSLEGMLSGETVEGVTPFSSIMEAYYAFPQHTQQPYGASALQVFDALRANYDSESGHERLQESLTTASWGEVFADVMYQRLLKIYNQLPYQDWRKVVSYIDSVPDFRSQHWMRTGGYANIPSVGEGSPYQYLTSPTDEEATMSVSKYGGLEDVTIEAISMDRVGLLRGIPQRMAYASARTIYELVMDMITVGGQSTYPTYDGSNYFYSVNHGNSGSSTLSVAGLNATQIAMRKQVPYNMPSTEYLGPRNKISMLVVPPDAEMLAKRVINPSDGYAYGLNYTVKDDGTVVHTPDEGTLLDPQAWKGSGIGILVYDKLAATDTNDWYALANPKVVDTMVVGFLNGRQAPELFTQDESTRSGNAFFADKITYKVRFFVGAGYLEHRGAYFNAVS